MGKKGKECFHNSHSHVASILNFPEFFVDFEGHSSFIMILILMVYEVPEISMFIKYKNRNLKKRHFSDFCCKDREEFILTQKKYGIENKNRENERSLLYNCLTQVREYKFLKLPASSSKSFNASSQGWQNCQRS